MLEMTTLPTEKEKYFGVIFKNAAKFEFMDGYILITKWKDNTPDVVKKRALEYEDIKVSIK